MISGFGPRQERRGEIPTLKIRGGAIRAKAGLGALSEGVVGPGWVITMGDGKKNPQNKKRQNRIRFKLFHRIGFGVGFGMRSTVVGNALPVYRLSAGPFIDTGGVERVRPVNKCGGTS
jgi:hypothetical protein